MKWLHLPTGQSVPSDDGQAMVNYSVREEEGKNIIDSKIKVMRSKAIAALIDDPSWFDRLELHGMPIHLVKGELIQEISEKVVDRLIDKGIISC